MAKEALVGTLYWRPSREFQVSGGADYERNDVSLFSYGTIVSYLNSLTMMGNGSSDLARLLRVPDGQTDAYAQRIAFSWDRRDAPFNAHNGTYVALGVEHVDSYPIESPGVDPTQQTASHVLRLTQTVAAYLPITQAVALAMELRLGEILNVAPCQLPLAPPGSPLPTYCTYPDRQFFMGGFDSMRGWLQDSFIPEDYDKQISSGALTCTSQSNCQVPLRGGNFMFNPRLELRFPLPVHLPIGGALFGDFGNLWYDPGYIFQTDPGASGPHGFPIRADVGAGVRVDTPVGPLVVDYGLNVTRRSYEDIGAFHFAIGLF
jgi:outer membrane protein assembly factor BamA